jgi:hypothetical protein
MAMSNVAKSPSELLVLPVELDDVEFVVVSSLSSKRSLPDEHAISIVVAVISNKFIRCFIIILV